MFMKKFRRPLGTLALALVCVMIGTAISLPTDSNALAETQTVVVTSPFTQAIADVRDSVVGVNNYQMVRYGSYDNNFDNYFGFGFGYGFGNGRGSDQQYEEREVLSSTGSGVVVGEGFVLTNYHVVEAASSLKVTVAAEAGDVKEYAASLVAYDENIDIAVIYAPKLPLEPVKLGDSDTLQVGDWAICIGNPLSATFSGTVTTGIVSALNRAIESESYDKYGRRETITNAMIQTDAAINSGNSGGGMFSVTGELMGIPTLKYTGSIYSGNSIDGIGMCIPINAAKPLIEDVLSGKIVATPPTEDEKKDETTNDDILGKPRLGITMKGMNTSHAALVNGDLPNGVYVDSVEAGSPAEIGGMQAGDIIVDVDDTVITDTRQLQDIVLSHKAGDTLTIKVYRAPGLVSWNSSGEVPEGEYVDLQVTLAVIDSITQ